MYLFAGGIAAAVDRMNVDLAMSVAESKVTA